MRNFKSTILDRLSKSPFTLLQRGRIKDGADKKRIYSRGLLIASVLLMLLNIKPVRAQQLSQDPLYKLVFVDEFDSLGLNTNYWRTKWDWGYNLWGKNKIKSCVANPDIFPGDTVDVAFNSAPPAHDPNGNRI